MASHSLASLILPLSSVSNAKIPPAKAIKSVKKVSLAGGSRLSVPVTEGRTRQFTTIDFRNLFSYARHGKYKQVCLVHVLS
jgi:hypothetical protein